MVYHVFAEAIVEYMLGILIFLVRIFIRTRIFGFRGWQGDDYLVLLAVLLQSIDAPFLKGLTDTHVNRVVPGLSDKELDKLIWNLKVGWMGWLKYISFLWCLKGAMAFYFSRLISGSGLPQIWLVRGCGVFIGLSYVTSMLVSSLRCLPVEKWWDVRKYPGPRPRSCLSSEINFWVMGSLNTLTDIVLLYIPVFVLWKIRLPLKRKFAIGIVLCSGVFVIVATLCRNIDGVISARNAPQVKETHIDTTIPWALREQFVSTIVVNAPILKSLFTSQVWITPANTRPRKSHPGGGSSSLGRSVKKNAPLVQLATFGSPIPKAIERHDTVLNTNWSMFDDIPNNVAGASDAEKGGGILQSAVAELKTMERDLSGLVETRSTAID